jgi:very-short-patch-repair endonuclease
MAGGPREPFIGSEALAGGALNRHRLRTQYAAVLPGVYASKRAQLSLQQRIAAGWLWSRRRGIICGLSASALHGAKWVDIGAPVELVSNNTRPPRGVLTRNDTMLDEEVGSKAGMPVSTPERTAYDIGRRAPLGPAVAHLDALAYATGFKAPDVLDLASRHPHVRGLRQLEAALDLVDAGAQSPQETWLRLLLVRAGFPRPRTQIPVLDPRGWPAYYLDMGWEDLMLGVEYEGDQHRVDRVQFARDISRLEKLDELGWTIVRVVAENRPDDIIRRVRRAWRNALSSRLN